LRWLKAPACFPLCPSKRLGCDADGCLSDLGPGFAKIKKTGKGYADMRSGMKALFVAGNVPDADLKADFLVVQTSHLTPLAEKADVLLPMAALYERGGTVITTYGQQKTFSPAQEPEAWPRTALTSLPNCRW